jgi:hypothetical protein
MEPTKRPPVAKPGMTSTELRSVIKQLVNMELKEAQALLDQCSLEKRAALLTRIGNIVLPRETAEDVKAGGTTTVTMYLGDDDEEPIVNEIPKAGPAKKPGRPMGSPNKRTQQTKEHLEAIFISEYNYISGRLGELSAEKRLDLLLKLAMLVIPGEAENHLRETVVTMNLD